MAKKKVDKMKIVSAIIGGILAIMMIIGVAATLIYYVI